MRHAESTLQRSCVTYFRLQYPRYFWLFFSVPNGGARGKVEAGILKAEGLLAGVSDLLLLYPGRGYHGLCIEMKTTDRNSRQRDNQKEFQKAVSDAGYLYKICRTFEDFTELVDWYLKA